MDPWRWIQELLHSYVVLCTLYQNSRIKKWLIKLTTNKYILRDVTPIPRNQNINLAVLNHWCYTHPNKSEIKFCSKKPITRRGC